MTLDRLRAALRMVAPAASIARSAAPAIARDAAGLGGAALVAIGAGEIYGPAGLIVGGLFLLGGAIAAARRA